MKLHFNSWHVRLYLLMYNQQPGNSFCLYWLLIALAIALVIPAGILAAPVRLRFINDNLFLGFYRPDDALVMKAIDLCVSFLVFAFTLCGTIYLCYAMIAIFWTSEPLIICFAVIGYGFLVNYLYHRFNGIRVFFSSICPKIEWMEKQNP